MKTTANDPDMLHHVALARALGISLPTFRTWVARGEWPLPHAIIGRTWLFPRVAYEHWRAHGTWPDGTRFQPGEGSGRRSPCVQRSA
jgi:hypothetical protein